MAAPTELPEIFLSHSGEQKGFVWNLDRALRHVNHKPFFDADPTRDSLPKGVPFPSRIVEACHACKVGVIVLSHEYIESMWPMLELQHILFHNMHSPHILPLFYKLKPADLSRTENLARWRTTWENQYRNSWEKKMQHGTLSSMSDSQPILDISLWPKALSMVRDCSGLTLPDNKDEHYYIQDIISSICRILPPPASFFKASYFKGREGIQNEIHKVFEEQQRRLYDTTNDSPGWKIPICVGLYGTGGSGKSTVCDYMLSFYANTYRGSCCYLQLPTKENEKQLLVESMKGIISQRDELQKARLDKIKKFEQVLPHFHQFLRTYRVFLVVDNIWDWALLDVVEILAARDVKYVQGSRLLVTARSRGLLRKLIDATQGRLAIQIDRVPSMSDKEALGALKAYSLSTWSDLEIDAEKLLGDIARSCFIDGQCHPLLLKTMGVRLRYLGHGSLERIQGLQSILSSLRALKLYGDENTEAEIVNVLRTSYDALSPRLQQILLLLRPSVQKYMLLRPSVQRIRGLQNILSSLRALKLYLYGDENTEAELVSVLRASYDALDPSLQKILLLLPSAHYRSTKLSLVCNWLTLVFCFKQSAATITAQMRELEYHGLIEIHQDRYFSIHDLHVAMIENVVRESPQPGFRELLFNAWVSYFSTGYFFRFYSPVFLFFLTAADLWMIFSTSFSVQTWVEVVWHLCYVVLVNCNILGAIVVWLSVTY